MKMRVFGSCFDMSPYPSNRCKIAHNRYLDAPPTTLKPRQISVYGGCGSWCGIQATRNHVVQDKGEFNINKSNTSLKM
jgi:hypothetical protein